MKYKLTNNTIKHNGRTLYQIQALKNFGYVKKGYLGGWVEKEDNLSQKGNCWVYDKAKVYENARVRDNAEVFHNAEVYGHSWVFNNAEVYGEARVYGGAKVCEDAEVHENAKVFGEVRIYNKAEVYGNSIVCGDAMVKGNARLGGNNVFSEGTFIGGGDKSGITDITDKTGTDYWAHQYVLGDYKIEPNEKTKLLEKADELIKKAEELKEQANKL